MQDPIDQHILYHNIHHAPIRAFNWRCLDNRLTASNPTAATTTVCIAGKT
jgi:hypothetical protein